MFWQCGPQHDRVQVAGVIGEVNPLTRIRHAIDPADREAAEQFRQSDDDMTGQRHSVVAGMT